MQRLIIPLRAALCAAALSAAATAAAAGAAQPACAIRPAAEPALTRLRAALAHGRFVTYQPTALTVSDGRIRGADAASIRADLSVLRPRFDSLVTYDAIHGAGEIPAIAAALRFRALIIGVWNPLNEAELRAAGDAVRRYPDLVVGLSLGNELLFAARSDPGALGSLIARLHAQLPQAPLSVSEPFHIYYRETAAPLLGQLDFLLANVHPLFQPWFRDADDGTSAQFVANVVDELAAIHCGPILVKETGVPTAPASAGYSEARQASFYRLLRERLPATGGHAFAYFAAFDAPWRAYDALAAPGAPPGVHPEEAHWGLYDAGRELKQAARELPPLTSPPSPP
ncbi:MAG: hypothetical protein E6K32_17930 [Gammaproteobacteria bacterium]|nr:MAG: hypothetical protein E6K32_17930 [Gammaproteobacteria bacterium]